MMLWGLRAVDVVGNSFCGNVSEDGDVPDGGGIASYLNGEDGHVRIANNVFVDNRATAWGGGVSLLQDVNAVVENNHFVGNRSAEGGGIGARSTAAHVRNNLFGWTQGGYGLSGSRPELLSLSYNAWYENKDTHLGPDFSASDTALLDVDPRLLAYSADGDCTNDELWPGVGSPLFDAGDPELKDPDGTRSDIGAFGGTDADPELFVDGDEDGYGLLSDCDDERDDIHPGADEVPYDGIDQDCSGEDLTDVDGDGFDGGPDGPDCDDERADVHPDAEEIWYDGVDGDCDGADDHDQDGDGFALDEDCDDVDPLVSPGAEEQRGDGVDSDCDGKDGAGGCGGCSAGGHSGGALATLFGLVGLGVLRRRRRG